MRTSSRQEAKPTMRFGSPWPVTIACARYRSSAAVAIVPLQHVNVTVSDILMMARTTARYIKCGWRVVVCRVTTPISCFRRDALSQLPLVSWVSKNSSTHPANYIGASADVKNLVPSKKRFGRLNTEMNVAPLGACATWTLPPGRHTKSPAPTLPSESSSDPSSMKGWSSAVCSCNGTTAPGAILNRMVERPSSSWYRIFISIPANCVRCQGIDDAATKVERSSGGLTGTGLFMTSPPICSGYLVDRDLVRDAAQRHASGRRLQPLGLQQGPGLRVLHHLFRHHD